MMKSRHIVAHLAPQRVSGGRGDRASPTYQAPLNARGSFRVLENRPVILNQAKSRGQGSCPILVTADTTSNRVLQQTSVAAPHTPKMSLKSVPFPKLPLAIRS